MSYDITGICNLGLGRIGANLITTIDDVGSPNAIKAKAIWQYIRDEVLQAKDWRFAKTRCKLAQSTTAPLYAYRFAYPLPSDFLRLVKPKQSASKGLNPVAYAAGYWYSWIDPTGYSRNLNYDPPVYPPGYPWVIEALPDGTLCLLTDYNNASFDLYINYIRRVTDPTKYTPTFINALATRVGAELAILITENLTKFKDMMGIYEAVLRSAEAVNESLDWLEDEAGSDDWVNAGR